MPSLLNAKDGERDICVHCGEQIILAAPPNHKGIADWCWRHVHTGSQLCALVEAEPLLYVRDENADRHMLISGWRRISPSPSPYGEPEVPHD